MPCSTAEAELCRITASCEIALALCPPAPFLLYFGLVARSWTSACAVESEGRNVSNYIMYIRTCCFPRQSRPQPDPVEAIDERHDMAAWHGNASMQHSLISQTRAMRCRVRVLLLLHTRDLPTLLHVTVVAALYRAALQGAMHCTNQDYTYPSDGAQGKALQEGRMGRDGGKELKQGGQCLVHPPLSHAIPCLATSIGSYCFCFCLCVSVSAVRCTSTMYVCLGPCVRFM